MGALTLKPIAYKARPWELSKSHVVNYERANTRDPIELLVQLRGNLQLLRVNSVGWINDRTRFIVDGLRRQRLVLPWVGPVLSSWGLAWSAWWKLLKSRKLWFRYDGWVAFHSVIHRAYQFFAGLKRRCVVSFDARVNCTVYHGIFGFMGPFTIPLLFLPTANPYEEQAVINSPVGSTSLLFWGYVVTVVIAVVCQRFIKLSNYSSSFTSLFYHRVTSLDQEWVWGSSALYTVSPIQKIIYYTE